MLHLAALPDESDMKIFGPVDGAEPTGFFIWGDFACAARAATGIDCANVRSGSKLTFCDRLSNVRFRVRSGHRPAGAGEKFVGRSE